MSTHIPTIGYITPSIFSSYFRLLLAGVQHAAYERQARLVIFQMTNSDVMRCLPYWKGIDGWVTCFASANTEQFYDPNRPTVKICEPHGGNPGVLIDNRGGMRSVVDHLIGLGRTRIAFVGFPENPDNADRLLGYKDALAAHGIPLDEALVLPASNLHVAAGIRFAERFVDEYNALGCDAVAFGTDNLALGALQTFARSGVRVPEDLAVAGFDDMPEAQTANPPLTTARIRFDAIGQVAVEHLLDILHGAPPAAEPIIMPTLLVPRRSAGENAEHEPAGATGDGAAFDQLARRLAETIAAPQKLGPGELPERLWPGIGMIISAIDSMFSGQTPPSDVDLQRAWASALRNVSYADPLEETLEQVETWIETRLESYPVDSDVRRRSRTIWRRIRTALLRVSIGGQVQRINRSEDALSFSDRVARLLADSSLEEVSGLQWLEHTSMFAAALGIWDESQPRRLQLAGTYPEAQRTDWQTVDQFPPPDLIDAARVTPLIMLPLQSARRDWGFLAIAMTSNLNTAAFDSSPLLAALITARIDSAMLQRERERQQAELRRAYDRARALADTVRELGCPVIPVSAGMLLVPLIGAIDSQRAQQIIATLLQAIEQLRAHEVLLDVSGVPVIDTHVAGVLIQLAQMARLLGAHTTLVGVRPEIAQSIVSLGVDLRGLSAHSSLVNAIQDATR